MQTGDIILTGVKSQGLVSHAIKLGAWIRRYPRWARRFSHAALVLDADGTLAEALSHGVKRTHISRFAAGDYVHIATGVDEHDQAQVRAFAEAVLAARTRYGLWTLAGLALYCLTGGALCVQRAGTAICSGFVADALTRGRFVWPRPPFALMPADLAVYFQLR